MIRVAVVEDCTESQRRIGKFIEHYAEEDSTPIEKDFYSDGIHIVDDFNGQYDIVFCDIQMKVMDGMETARNIRRKDKNVIIIFITNLAEYAIQGYEVAAAGYLLKPLQYTVFSLYMKRAVKKIQDRKIQYLTVETKSGIRRYALNDIYYIDYEKHYVWIHKKDGCNKELLSMKNLEVKLSGKSFSRCNSGCIVNLMHVQEIKNNIVIVNGDPITISRSRKKMFMDELTEYLGGKGNDL